jgi:hypothetical protein
MQPDMNLHSVVLLLIYACIIIISGALSQEMGKKKLIVGPDSYLTFL